MLDGPETGQSRVTTTPHQRRPRRVRSWRSTIRASGTSPICTRPFAPRVSTAAPSSRSRAPRPWHPGSATTRPSRRSAAPARLGAVRAQPEANVLVYGSGQDISNLDPHTGHDYSITWGQRAVYDSLLRYEGKPAELKPLLATEVIGSPDATTWTIKLGRQRHLPRWFDRRRRSGEVQLPAHAAQEPRRGLDVRRRHGPGLDQSRRSDDASRSTLLKPFAPYDAVLPWLFVANPTLVQEHDVDGDEGEAWLKENEAGGGPFTIKRWEIGNIYEFDALPGLLVQPGERHHAARQLRLAIIRESSTKRIAMETGELQYGDRFSPEDDEALAATPASWRTTTPSLTPFAIKLNNQVGPTSDINVRKALSHAFDYDAAIEAVSGRGAVMAGTAGDRPDAVAQGGSAGPAPRHGGGRRRLWRRAQFADGFEMEYVYVTGLTPGRELSV